jgi:hypothetical protein
MTDLWSDPDFVRDELEVERPRPRHQRPPIWIAASDGIAHARSHVASPRTACGAVAIHERHAWPETSRCGLCVAVLERVAEMAR